MPNREEALALVREYTQSESLIKHMLAVEAAMRAYAEHFGEDPELWGVTGLVHDFDYERWPNEKRNDEGHPYPGVEILREKGYPDELLDAVMGHAEYTGTPRESPLAKTLFAVDELCGFITAVAYVRPNGLDDLKPKSVKKKLRDKRYAAKVSREDIRVGIEELGVEENEHISLCVKAMAAISEALGI